jgi:hypothetical protein
MPIIEQSVVVQAVSRAQQEIRNGNLSAAIQIYNFVLQHEPHHSFVKKSLQKLTHQQNTTKQAESSPSQKQIKILSTLFHSGQMLETEQLCIQLLQKLPQSLVLNNLIAVVYKNL